MPQLIILIELGFPPTSPVNAANFQGFDTVYRTKSDSKQRQYFVFNHAMALPEYVVEYDYLPEYNSVENDLKPHANPNSNRDENDFDSRNMDQTVIDLQSKSEKIIPDPSILDEKLGELKIPQFSVPVGFISEKYFQVIDYEIEKANRLISF